jgi:hypothetical protein
MVDSVKALTSAKMSRFVRVLALWIAPIFQALSRVQIVRSGGLIGDKAVNWFCAVIGVLTRENNVTADYNAKTTVTVPTDMNPRTQFQSIANVFVEIVDWTLVRNAIAVTAVIK